SFHRPEDVEQLRPRYREFGGCAMLGSRFAPRDLAPLGRALQRAANRRRAGRRTAKRGTRDPEETMPAWFRSTTFALIASLAAGRVAAQSLTADVGRDYRTVRDYLIRSAEKMPEADYDFRPAPEVRTFGQQVAHVADDQYNLCAPAKGETRKAAYREIENTVHGKTALVAALKAAFAYCDGAYDGLTDANGGEATPWKGETKF